MNILFICSQNKRRSLTAEKMFDGTDGNSVRSAGTENNSRIKVTPGLIGWADLIFCFEKKHLRRLKEKYSEELSGKRVVTLNIPDEYSFMDEDLQDQLRAIYDEYVGRE